MSPPGRPERQIRALRRRDPAAVERWFLDHADGIYTFVFYRVGRDPDVAEDVVQETFVSALNRIRDFDMERGSMRTWLTLLARNCIRNVQRSDARSISVGDDWEAIDAKLAAAFADISASPLQDEVIRRRETADLVRMTLANLPSSYRDALIDHHVAHRSLREMARSCGCSESAVKSLLFRARASFRAAFKVLADAHRSIDAETEVL